MSALDELHVQCERRGWRLALTGHAHNLDGTIAKLNMPAMLLDGLEVRGVRGASSFGRELMARVAVDGLAALELDRAAVTLARALEAKGLIT